ncbi:MAG: SEC-C domain-containing protein, partial [Caulobacterales bacterium]|nr:SEC-C domain-containing protein [Caulobacterales bacterium]
VIGSERHESRRIDNQLRGRTGRQGDPGRSRFFISLDDDLLRIFAPERLDAIMRGLGMKEGEAIVHPWMNKALETSQKRVEQRNFEIRKNLLKYDDVINDQRKAIFEQRVEFMTDSDVSDVVADMRREIIEEMVRQRIPPKAYAEQWDVRGLTEDAAAVFGVEAPIADWAQEEGIADEEILERLIDTTDKAYAAKSARVSPDIMRRIEKQVLLQTIDVHWREHLQQLDHLRSVIHLRGYGQRDPLNEFKTEAFALFERMLADLRADVTRVLSNLRVQVEEPPAPPKPPTETVETHRDPVTGRNEMAPSDAAPGPARPPRVAPGRRDPADPKTWGRVGRNEACPCGSGKKFKHCHGAVPAQA